MLYFLKNDSNSIPFIEKKNYNNYSSRDFFGINDPVRLVIFLFILSSFILNIIIITISIKRKKEKEKEGFSLSGILTLNILLVNFFHTLSYIFNWVIKNDDTKYKKGPNNLELNVGALLLGNPSNHFLCYFQGFLLICLSMSQDFIINIFFAFVNMEGKEKRHIFIIIIIIAGYIFPLSITLIYSNMDLLGINEKVCYIKKYAFEIKGDKVEYHLEEHYNIYKAIIFIIRGFNYILTLFFIIRAIRYIRRSNKKDKKVDKLISSLPVIGVAFFTLSVYLIFRIIFFINSKLEEEYINIYLIMNSVDAFLLPLSFFINHRIYKYFCCCCPKIKYQRDTNDYDNDNDSSIRDGINGINLDSL